MERSKGERTTKERSPNVDGHKPEHEQRGEVKAAVKGEDAAEPAEIGLHESFGSDLFA